MSQADLQESDGRRTTRLTRREILAGVASMGVLPGAMPKLLRRESEVVDVLVVGGGVSGCYAAWRLAAASPGDRIELHERGDRIGGRLWSVKPAGMSQQVAELGGLRIADNQTPLLGLVASLGLSVDPYPATTAKDIYYARGIRTRAGKMVAGPDSRSARIFAVGRSRNSSISW